MAAAKPHKWCAIIFQCPLPSLILPWDVLPLTCLAQVPQGALNPARKDQPWQ